MTAWIRPVGLCCALAGLLLPLAAQADFHIRSPDDIDPGEWELEHNGSAAIDKSPEKGGANSYTAEIGRGVNDWWHTELELDIDRQPGPDQSTKIDGITWENTFRLTEPGENWADYGLYWEYAHATLHGQADAMLFGPLIQKDVGRTTHTLNLFLSKQIGSDQDNHGWATSFAWQSRWNIFRLASPAVEAYGEGSQLLAGPVMVGSTFLGGSGKLKYELGYLFGATSASPAGTVRWRLEWELPL